MTEPSFLKKLQKGMGVNISTEEVKETVKKEENKPERTKVKIKKESKRSKPPKIEMRAKILEEEEEEKKEKKEASEQKQKWLEPEGQLAIDVYQTEKELVIHSAIAGVKPEDLDISVENDVIIIRGRRNKPIEEEGDYFTQECYWGAFSREIIIPVEADPGRVEASIKEGVLTIRVPKIIRERKRKVVVKRST